MADPDWEAGLMARGVLPDSVPDAAAPRRWKRIVMTTGSHHMQTYWVAASATGGSSASLALAAGGPAMDPARGRLIRPPEGARTFDVWHDSCIECHAVAGEKNFERGKGWEAERRRGSASPAKACHGPADEHVRANEIPCVATASASRASPTRRS
ncbi:MAG: hypothetical protein R3E53_02465 [Myxococcota bacterium]